MSGRRWLRIGLWVLAILLTLRLLLALLLVPLAGLWIGARGLELRVHEHSLSVWKGELLLDSVELRARDERGAPRGAPILELDWLRVNLSMSELLTGGLVVERLELDGLRVEAERDAGGQLNWSRFFAGPQASGGPVQPAPTDSKLAFDLPLVIEELRIGGVDLHWIDRKSVV